MLFLDTNTCIYFLKASYPSILREFKKHKPEEIKIPSLVKAELLLGVEKSVRREENLKLYEKFMQPFEVIPFDDLAVNHYAQIRGRLEKKGRIIGPNDLIIAATVLSRNGILVTHNTKEFKQIPGLQLRDWVEAI